MKKFLLFAAAALIVSSAGAQMKAPSTQAVRSKAAVAKQKLAKLPQAQQMDLSKITSTKEMSASNNVVKPDFSNKAPQKAGYMEPFYKRPAGMYVSPFNASDGAGFYSFGSRVFLMMKPFADYLFEGECEGDDENTTFAWDVFIRDEYYPVDYAKDVAFNSYWSLDEAPKFFAFDGDLAEEGVNSFEYQYSSYDTEENVGGNVSIKATYPGLLLSSDNSETVHLMFDDESLEFMYSSKSMVPGGIHGDKYGMLSRYYGAEPWEDNEYGWWFGKNASHVDGMAMAFEKPQHPYLLKNVYLQAAFNDAEFTGMVVNAPVKMTCRVYKLDEIPAYQENGSASLPVEPGELIVTGEATVTPTTGEANNGLITFTLYGQDEIDPTLTYEYHPTIDYPILICIDGYNDEGMEDLVEFTAYCSIDDDVDEGYGELCYLKQGIFEYEYDEQGDTVFDDEGNPVRHFTGEYYWRGLNNYFSGGTLGMKTGLSIFIGTENPFMTFNYGLEDGEYTFPAEGGRLVKDYEYSDGTITVEGIEFFCSYPSEDGDWWLTYKGSDELPDWLEINLIDNYDEETGEFTGGVVADVTAAPLPEGMTYREATIRFEIPGDYIDYKFMQGVGGPLKGDVNGDGEVNIADVNCLIEVILGYKSADEFEGRAYVNDDDEVNIADVNAVIEIILRG